MPATPCLHNERNLENGSDYHFATDAFTPGPDQAGPLKENVANPEVWGNTPLDYVCWFDNIWHTGDPSRWGPEVFTKEAVMIDSAGTSTGGEEAASEFLLLFKYFPALRGEVISWAHNNTEIMINWRFVVSNGRMVPVIDKFSFVKGLVSFRQAYFDTNTFLSYLAENYGSGPLVDYFEERYLRSTRGGGFLYLPGLLWALLKGIFLWSAIPPDAPTGLTATTGAGQVLLRWKPVSGASSYRVMRALTIDGSYRWIASTVKATSYLDMTVENGKEYFYRVCANATERPASAAA